MRKPAWHVTNVSSNMTAYLSSLLNWTVDNDTSKTKEMILGRIDSSSISPVSTAAGPIQRVTNFKLLGINLDASLSWTTHINIIVSKASKRLYFLKQLRRAGVSSLLLFYTSVIRPVLDMPPEYGIILLPTPNLSSWNQSKNEQYILSSPFLMVCHIPISYLSLI